LKGHDEMRSELNEVKRNCVKRKTEKMEDIINFTQESKHGVDCNIDDETCDLILARRLKK